jgi:hypothetical protein
MPKGMRVQVPPRAPNLHRANNFAAPLFSQFKLLKKKDLAELPALLEKSTNPLLQRDSIPSRWHASGKVGTGRQMEAPRKTKTAAPSARYVDES